MKIGTVIHQTSFVVMPDHCNYMSPLIFGGKLFAEMDLCAAVVSSKVLSHSETADNAVTHKFEGEFIGPSYLGDVIYLDGWLTELREKSMKILVNVNRVDRKNMTERSIRVATAEFVFVARNGDEYARHGLRL